MYLYYQKYKTFYPVTAENIIINFRLLSVTETLVHDNFSGLKNKFLKQNRNYKHFLY